MTSKRLVFGASALQAVFTEQVEGKRKLCLGATKGTLGVISWNDGSSVLPSALTQVGSTWGNVGPFCQVGLRLAAGCSGRG